jgi:prepilin-type N-terminal cleavage/methylation domain-containing protein
MSKMLRKQNGVTLIELLIALVISTLLTAAIYRTFVGQQKTLTTQEQVVDAQQNIRYAMGNMTREIRMAGFGNMALTLPLNINGTPYNNIVNPDTPAAGALTFLSAVNVGSTLTAAGGISQNQIVVSSVAGFAVNGNVSIGGVESNVISAINGVTNTITLTNPLVFNHLAGTPVFLIRAIAYQIVNVSGVPVLMRNDGGGNQPEADNIEALQFQYLDANGNPTGTPANIRIIRVSMTARTERPDFDFKDGGDGRRRRQIDTNIHLRNMGV